MRKLVCNLLGKPNEFAKFAARSMRKGLFDITDSQPIYTMRKADLVTTISEKTGVPKVDVLVTIEAFFKEVKDSLSSGENVYVRGFGSFVVKRRAKKIGRHIKRNVAIEIPEHSIPAFKPAKVFVDEVKKNTTKLDKDKLES